MVETYNNRQTRIRWCCSCRLWFGGSCCWLSSLVGFTSETATETITILTNPSCCTELMEDSETITSPHNQLVSRQPATSLCLKQLKLGFLLLLNDELERPNLEQSRHVSTTIRCGQHLNEVRRNLSYISVIGNNIGDHWSIIIKYTIGWLCCCVVSLLLTLLKVEIRHR